MAELNSTIVKGNLSVTGDLKVNGSCKNLNSDTDLSLFAGGSINLETQDDDINISANEDIVLSAGGDIKANGYTNISLSSTSLDLHATGDTPIMLYSHGNSYGLATPDMSSWTGQKTMATTDNVTKLYRCTLTSPIPTNLQLIVISNNPNYFTNYNMYACCPTNYIIAYIEDVSTPSAAKMYPVLLKTPGTATFYYFDSSGTWSSAAYSWGVMPGTTPVYTSEAL